MLHLKCNKMLQTQKQSFNLPHELTCHAMECKRMMVRYLLYTLCAYLLCVYVSPYALSGRTAYYKAHPQLFS